jgi:tetratricopeptide (TPR) repeat protein
LIALGDSCFARKLWRQAALHLGAAAAHPEASKQPAVVAAALVRAAQAETRALRPTNASKHLEAAVRFAPDCAPAWHALAEIAMDLGDVKRSADCLEREAAATSEPKDRLRLFDALGDMALEVLGDPERAERYWREVLDLGETPVLDKLLAAQRKRGAGVERADTCERLAKLAPDVATRKALLMEAVEALQTDGAVERAIAVAEALIDVDPRDPDSIVCATSVALAAEDTKRATAWARRLVGAGHPEDVCAGLELVRAIGAPLTDEDQRFLAAHPPKPMASDEGYAGAVDDDERRDLIDDPAERPLRDLFALLSESLPLVFPSATAALVEAGVPDAARVPASSGTAASSLYPQIARLLGGPPTLLYSTPKAAADVTLVPASPPLVVLGPKLASVRAQSHADSGVGGDAALRFQLGRVVELSRPYRVFASMGEADLALFVAALRHAFGPEDWSAVAGAIVAEGERLRSRFPVAVRQRLTEHFAAVGKDALDVRGYVAACRRAADRAGLLACGDVSVAIELAGGARAAQHLVRMAVSKRYLAVRKKLRARA